MFCRGSGSFVVQERGSLALTNIALDPEATIDLSGGGSLSLALMAVPATALGSAEGTLSGVGSTLRLDAVTAPEWADVGEMTATTTVAADGSKAEDPPGSIPGFFLVSSGCSARDSNGVCTDETPPCAVSEGGRCVGRPEGYGPHEDCAITVVVGGVLAPCAVFDTNYGHDMVTLPGGAEHRASDCPVGVALASGDVIAWQSSGNGQGSVGHRDDGCAAKGTCGLPYNDDGNLGGGWQLCFA
eukprot:COSAG04_NODE_683_length_11182_cov_15.270775_11_plen_242_part_00